MLRSLRYKVIQNGHQFASDNIIFYSINLHECIYTMNGLDHQNEPKKPTSEKLCPNHTYQTALIDIIRAQNYKKIHNLQG